MRFFLAPGVVAGIDAGVGAADADEGPLGRDWVADACAPFCAARAETSAKLIGMKPEVRHACVFQLILFATVIDARALAAAPLRGYSACF